jgi:LysM repeat protein
MVIPKEEGVKKCFLALLSFAAAVPALGLCPDQARGQSLRGSQASVQRMYTRAVLNDLQFFSTSKGIYESVRDGELVMISITMDLTLEKVRYPFALPRTRDVLNVFAKQYHQACGERLVVTSAARPRTEQPRNASPQSVHPTGMAIDFRKPSGDCLRYMRGQLMALEKMGVLEATEERHPVHFHVAVLQRGKFAPATPAVATATTPAPAPTVPASPMATGGPAPAPVATTDSASGTVEVPAPKPAKARVYQVYTVKKGDNLSTIARRHGLTVSRLKSLNGLKTSSIRPGQKLRTG